VEAHQLQKTLLKFGADCSSLLFEEVVDKNSILELTLGNQLAEGALLHLGILGVDHAGGELLDGRLGLLVLRDGKGLACGKAPAGHSP